ncbi:MAG: hypothetical protein ACXVBY_19750, partial [Isosphaeraceae bacterium]
MPRADQPVGVPDGIQRAAVGSVRILLRLQVGLEDRLNDQNHGHLRHAIPNRTDLSSILHLFAKGVWDSDRGPWPPIGSWAIRSRSAETSG